MRRIIFLFFLFSMMLFPVANSQVRVRLLSAQKPLYIWFTPVTGTYNVIVSGKSFTQLPAGETAIIACYEGKTAFRKRGESGIYADSIKLECNSTGGTFRIDWGSENEISRKYSGNLASRNDMGSLLLVNDSQADDYIAGVVMAEGGNGNTSGYFSVQALIARTYFVRHASRHSKDHYNVCDDVHCQVYKGLTANPMINNAVRSTSGEIIVTPDSVPIISAFHSNCGGETSPSEFAWVESLPYLKKVSDPWCVSTVNSSWSKQFKREEWINALRKGGYSADPANTDFGFLQSARAQNYITGTFSIPFRDLRASLNLRSAWFSVADNGQMITLTGKGYGHGVGLCQEGAMKMAREGYTYDSIIKTYYPGVLIIDIAHIKKGEKNN